MAGQESQTVNRYLEAVFYMQAEGERVRAARLAEWLGVSQPTAGATLQRLVRDGLVQLSAQKEVSLTAKGQKVAAAVVRRHRIAERWLTDVLGLDWLQADEEAGKLEHAMSDAVAEKLYTLIGEPATCPHGNPIPGAKQPRSHQRPLRALPLGETSHVRRVSEVAEHEAPELLSFLGRNRLGLGAEVRCVEVNPGAGIQVVEVGGAKVPMSLEVAGKIWVD